MKFNNYDELLNYLKDKELPSLEFDITVDETNVPREPELDTCTGDCEVVTDTQPAKVTEYVDVQIKSLYDSPTMKFKVGDHNAIVVESFNHIPNTCSTSEIALGDRKIMTSICEDENGKPSIELFVECNGNYTKKKFVLYTTDSGIESQIKLND